MVIYTIRAITFLVQLLTLLIIIKVFLSYFMSPIHPLRYNLDRILEPMLVPIRGVIHPIGMLDLSPLVLIIIAQLLGRVVIGILNYFA